MNQENRSGDVEALPASVDKKALRAEREKLREIQKSEAQAEKRIDAFKIILAAIFIGAGFWLYYNIVDYVPQIASYVRFVFPVLGILIALMIVFFWCSSGKRLVAYIRDAVQEVKKVVWPTHTYTVKLTGFVLLFVAVLALYLYGIDTVISLLFGLVLTRG